MTRHPPRREDVAKLLGVSVGDLGAIERAGINGPVGEHAGLLSEKLAVIQEHLEDRRISAAQEQLNWLRAALCALSRINLRDALARTK